MSNGSTAGRTGKNKAIAARPNYRVKSLISWSDIEPEDLAGLVVMVQNAGGAVMVGRTSDGGALSITILVGEQKVKEYPKNKQEFHELYMWLKDDFLG